MASNEALIIAKYKDGQKEESRATSSRSGAFEFHYTKKHLEEYVTPDTRILEVGCGTGYYGMHYAPLCREYVGIDIVPAHIDRFRAKIEESGRLNVSCRVGDATNLADIPDGAFDVVLCLGPCYHLPPAEREVVIRECYRVCRAGGIVAVAYINKIGLVAGACVFDDWRHIYPSEAGNRAALVECTDDLHPGVFFFTTPEEMNALTASIGLKKEKNLGTDFLILAKVADTIEDERFHLLLPVYDQLTSHESCTGASNHALYVGRKPQ
ncbi:MAG: class I SAM-dependent methyltransferase [Clostridia bacterium]|nr:class I SAM-dependent methyltransferase [Clostridia bacterium]